MPLDPRAQRFLDIVGAGGARTVPASVEDQRRAFVRLMQSAGAAPPPVPTRDLSLPGAAGDLYARLYDPVGDGVAQVPGLVFFHGGGLVAGSIETHHAICATLAEGSGCRVVSVAYRLAPEHPYPAAVDDALAATRAVFAQAATLRLDPARIAVGGDSVGGNLTASVCREIAQGGGPTLKAQLLICPVLDARGDSPSHRDFRTGYFLERGSMERDMAAYAGDRPADYEDPKFSPFAARDLSGLPPTVIETAEYDPVRDDGAVYAERLAAAGVPVRYTCHPGMIHLFYGFGRVIPAGPVALREMAGRLAEAMA